MHPKYCCCKLVRGAIAGVHTPSNQLSSHPARVAVDASHDGVAELAVLGALIEGLHHDGLAAGVAPGQQDNDLARLDAVKKTDATSACSVEVI